MHSAKIVGLSTEDRALASRCASICPYACGLAGAEADVQDDTSLRTRSTAAQHLLGRKSE
jgi:hypothetical protein